ncbi:hypothetical protein QA641_28085 [Bradyrhizobium sp. CB1650]|uniref:hypothetical protein n=1 Tax=Bradyrhizobium sp. CB1650 TaxID=3039153 RepID=UPI00243551B8|nr:hypothetical protein [Bradyrhizobium sp. CB1650]WGD49481.1 hypothetical protein QA641_28085 [Bradyrhizobium sp. CB1650]
MIERQFGKAMNPRKLGTALLRTIIKREDFALDGRRLLRCGGERATIGNNG